MPRRTSPLWRRKDSRFFSQSEASATLSSTSAKPTLVVSLCPVIVSSPARRALIRRRARGSISRRSASRSIWLSEAKTTCGSPNPRKAPEGTVFVRTARAAQLAAESGGHGLLHVERALHRAVDDHARTLGPGDHPVGLDVRVLLVRSVVGALHHHDVGAAERDFDLAAPDLPLGEDLAGGKGLLHVEPGGQDLVL